MISTFQLPMPPSINHYYGHCVTRDKKPRIYIMPKGLWYRQQVYFLTANKIKKLDNPFWDVPLYAYIKFFPRYTGRDIDNPLKCLFDADSSKKFKMPSFISELATIDSIICILFSSTRVLTFAT